MIKKYGVTLTDFEVIDKKNIPTWVRANILTDEDCEEIAHSTELGEVEGETEEESKK